jgi:hypothetical membrane protein
MATTHRPNSRRGGRTRLVAPAHRTRGPDRDRRAGGLLLSLAGTAVLMGCITAEALHPGPFSTHTNTLSHLGASEPPDSVVVQPSAAVFDGTMLTAGALILLATWLCHRTLHRTAVTVSVGLLGVGTLGVGLFPLTHPAPHTLLALLTFYAGGAAMIISARTTAAPFRTLWTTLGVVALAAITLGVFALSWAPVAELGEGGIERWNAYLIVLWLVAFGSHLMSTGGVLQEQR